VKLKLKLTVINAGLVTLFLALLSALILYQAAALQREAAAASMLNLAESTAKTIEGRCQRYLDAAKSIAQIMNSYKSVEPPLRRLFFNQIMRGVLDENFGFTGIYAVWKPNALDGMDAEYAGTPGAGADGRFQSHWTRERGRGRLDLIPYADPGEALRDLSLDDLVSNPLRRNIHGKDVWIVRVRVPIVDETNAALGVVGIDVDTGDIQSAVEAVAPYGTGHAAAAARDRTLLGYFDPVERGRNVSTVFDPDSAAAVGRSLETGKNALVITAGGRGVQAGIAPRKSGIQQGHWAAGRLGKDSGSGDVSRETGAVEPRVRGPLSFPLKEPVANRQFDVQAMTKQGFTVVVVGHIFFNLVRQS
jgi:hypothetical protein